MTVWLTPEEDKFILENADRYGCTEMARKLTEMFGVNRRHGAVAMHCKEVLKIKLTNPNRVRYTKKHIDFMKKCEVAGMTLPEMATAFNAEFGTKTTRTTMERACKRYGLFSARRGLAMEAGKKNPFSPRSKIGSEIQSGGKIYVKVSDDCVNESGVCIMAEGKNWREKKRVVYEEAYGSIPDGMYIVHLNNDKSDFRPENLYAITPQINMLMAANRWFSEVADVTLTAIKYCELFFALKETEIRGEDYEHQRTV